MPIAVFDIDGTLTDTMSVDVECYEKAVFEIVGIEIPSHWQELDDVTDSGILVQACRLADQPVPDAETQRQIAKRVGELLGAVLEVDPERFMPIPGARQVFGMLRSVGWDVAIGTGAWRPSALIKLRGAEIPHSGVPLVTSSEQPARREIIRLASEAAAADPSARVVYVGDGVWDGRAAESLGFGFVGVGSGEKALALSKAGAVGCVEDLSDETRFLSLLKRAANEC